MRGLSSLYIYQLRTQRSWECQGGCKSVLGTMISLLYEFFPVHGHDTSHELASTRVVFRLGREELDDGRLWSRSRVRGIAALENRGRGDGHPIPERSSPTVS